MPRSEIKLNGSVASKGDYKFVRSWRPSTCLISHCNVKFTPLKAGEWSWNEFACIKGNNSQTAAIMSGGADVETDIVVGEKSADKKAKAHITTTGPDGKLYKTDEEKKNLGTIVIRDTDGVYAGKKEPAQRRKIVLTGPEKAKVRVARGSASKKLEANLKLFDAQNAGSELFVAKNEILVEQGDYWLQGGEHASEKSRDQFLKVKLEGGEFTDQINVTVLWVDISASTEGKIIPKKLADESMLVTGLKSPTLGVLIGKQGQKKSRQAKLYGFTNILGDIKPSDLSFGEKPFTKGFKDGDTKKNLPATVKFGFLFRRIASSKTYGLAQEKPLPGWDFKDVIDDSSESFQAFDPFPQGDKLLIADVDGPGPNVDRKDFVVSFRGNFDEHVVFTYTEKVPERASEKLKWAVTIDGGGTRGPNRELSPMFGLFLRREPNKADPKDPINVVLVGSHLANLDLGIPKAKLEAAMDKELEQGEPQLVEVVGENLIGQFVLRRQKNELKPLTGIYPEDKKTPGFSDAKKISLLFDVPKDAVVGEYELVCINAAGISEPLKGFKISKKEGK